MYRLLAPLADDAAVLAMKKINPPKADEEFTNPPQRKVTGTMVSDEGYSKTSALLQVVASSWLSKNAEQGFAMPTISARDPFAKKPKNLHPNSNIPQANTNIKGLGEMGYGGFKGAFLNIPGFKEPVSVAKTTPNQVTSQVTKAMGPAKPSPQLSKSGGHDSQTPFSGGTIPADHNPTKNQNTLSQRMATDESARPTPTMFRKNIFGYFVEKKAIGLGTMAGLYALKTAPLIAGKLHKPTGDFLRKGVDWAGGMVDKAKASPDMQEHIPTFIAGAEKAVKAGKKLYPNQAERELALKPLEKKAWLGKAIAMGVPLLASGFVAGAFNPTAGNFMRQKVLGTWSKGVKDWLPSKANIGGLDYNPQKLFSQGASWLKQKYTPFTTGARLEAGGAKTQERYMRRYQTQTPAP